MMTPCSCAAVLFRRRRAMKIYRSTSTRFLVCPLLLLTVLCTINGSAQSKKSKYACTEQNPAQLCNAGNTCGSADSPCTVDVKRTPNAASVTAGTSNKKTNAPFCVKSGTQVVWMSSQKNTGFVVDFGAPSPFESDNTVIGGSNRQVTTVAKNPGCFRHSVGACVSGAAYGMCGTSVAEMIVTP